MEFKNHKIREAICAFHFEVAAEDAWNVGKFSDFYKEIEVDGYTISEERTPVEVNLEFNLHTDQPKQARSLGELQILYTNKEKSYGIIMSKAFISFHSINHYEGWEFFFPKIERGLEAYRKIGLGKQIKTVQMSYINDFQIEFEEKLVEYLSFVPDMSHFEQGRELNQLFQSDFAIDLSTFLHLQSICKVLENGKRQITLQCNCRANISDTHTTWKALAGHAHDNAVKAFKTVTQEEFKNQIR